jgi:hypothetical protein
LRISSTAWCGNWHKFPDAFLFHASSRRTVRRESVNQLRAAQSQLPFFPELPAGSGRLAAFLRSEEPFFLSVISQAVVMTRWEQNK